MAKFNYKTAKANSELIINAGGHKPVMTHFGTDYIGVIYDDGSTSYFDEKGSPVDNQGHPLELINSKK